MRDRRQALLVLLCAGCWLTSSGRVHAEATPGRSAALQLSGQHRLLYGHASAAELGVGTRPGAGVSVGLLRNLLGLALTFPARDLRLQAQLGAHYAFGTAERAEPPDADWGDVHLLFIEWTRRKAEAKGFDVQLRVGRQEMPLGSTRWFSARDGTNVRQALDIARLTLSGERLEAHAFAGLVPKLRRAWFDDAPDPWSRLFGGYLTWHVLPAKLLSLDLFALARHRPGTRYQGHSGRELRRTFGMRLFGETRFGLEYVLHGLAQWGKLADATVRAWGAAAALWQRILSAPYELRIGLRGDALSGDGRRNDRTVGTFHPLFPNQAFFSTQPAIFPANLYDLHPLLKFVSEALDVELGCALFWRQRASDAVYGAGGQALFQGDRTRRAFTGAQLSGELTYRANARVTLMLAYAQLFPGPALRAAGGGSVRFLAGSMTYSY